MLTNILQYSTLSPNPRLAHQRGAAALPPLPPNWAADHGALGPDTRSAKEQLMSSAALLSLRAVLLGACARVRLGVLGALFFFFFFTTKTGLWALRSSLYLFTSPTAQIGHPIGLCLTTRFQFACLLSKSILVAHQ